MGIHLSSSCGFFFLIYFYRNGLDKYPLFYISICTWLEPHDHLELDHILFKSLPLHPFLRTGYRKIYPLPPKVVIAVEKFSY